MIEYTESLIWLATWPLIIFLGYTFTAFNMKHFLRLEKFYQEEKDSSRINI